MALSVSALSGLVQIASAADSAADWARMKGITPRGYVCYRAAEVPQIDGELDDAAWQRAPWTEEFVDIEGDRQPRPRFRTRAKVLWDDEQFYLAAQLDEPHVWATLTRHDSVIFQDNDMEVFIDPDGDNHEYYEFEMNALNTSWDLFLPKPYKDGGKADNSWEIPGLKSAVKVRGTLNNPADTDEGWSIEIAIPWRVLRQFARRPTPPRHGDQWRVNFSRVEWQHEVVDGKYRKVAGKREDNWVWSPQGIIDMHRPERWGYVQFSTAEPGTTKFVADPALAARDRLMEVYHHQKSFQQKNARWAKDLSELGLAADDKLKLEATPEGFLATLDLSPARDRRHRWLVRQDSKLWSPDSTDETAAAIESVLWQQADAWNKGDIGAFMEHYWKSDELTFSSGGQTTRGWQATKDNYVRRYPTRDAMGQLTFSQLEITPLESTAALVLGQWRLARNQSPVGGNFSLVLRKINGRWLIIHDHTSRAEPRP